MARAHAHPERERERERESLFFSGGRGVLTPSKAFGSKSFPLEFNEKKIKSKIHYVLLQYLKCLKTKYLSDGSFF